MNKPFCCYKFLSLYINVGDEGLQDKKDDVHITPIGKILRRTSLDEMPEFIMYLSDI
jgi:lipopolysaccharide/colanic/teichoic acid biosynthesis glycosyltransferase